MHGHMASAWRANVGKPLGEPAACASPPEDGLPFPTRTCISAWAVITSYYPPWSWAFLQIYRGDAMINASRERDFL